MAAYEVLLLNTAIPQIQAAQSGDTYVVPRDIAFSAALTLSAGTANGVPYLNGSKVLTTGSALTFDGTKLGVASGNIDVVSASFVGSPLIAARFNASNFRMGIGIGNSNGFPFLGANVNNAANDNGTFDINGYASRIRLDNGVFQVQTSSASGTAGNAITWTTPLYLDASGNLVVGGTAAINTAVNRGNITINGTSSSILVLGTGGTERGYFYTQGTDIICNSSTGSFTVQTGGANPVIFGTNNTEAARITSDRNLLVGETSSNSGNNGLKVKGQFALTTSQAFTASGSVNDSAYYIVCYSLSATCTLTLPTPANNTGRLLNIVVQSAQQVVSASSNVTAITNGALGTAILPATAGKWAQLWCDGTYWNIIATNV